MIDGIIASGKITKTSGLKILNLVPPDYETLSSRPRPKKYRLNNLHVDVDYNNKGPVSISIMGSPNKFNYGNNANNYTIFEFKESLIELSHKTGIDCMKLNLHKVEVGSNFIMKNTPPLYTSSLFGHPESRMKKSQLKNFQTVYFENSTRKKMIFYDKGAESVKSIPDELIRYNLLRYEYILKRKINESLGSYLTVGDLLNKEIYNQLLKLWRDHYFKLIRKDVSTFKGKPKVSDLTPFFSKIGISSFGYTESSLIIENGINDFKLKGNEATRPRSWLKNQMTEDKFSKPLDLFIELDEKVQRVYESNLIL